MTIEDDHYCFACGPGNPIGLQLEFETEPEGISRTVWTPKTEHQGYRNITHGGLVATVLDECMIRMLWHLGVPAVTAHLEVDLKLPAMTGEPLYCEGRVLRDRGRVLEVEADARNEAGDVVARATSKAVVRGERIEWRLGPTEK